MAEFTLKQLSYFLAIAEEGTITDAALRLHVSASALSTAMTELERSLNSQLLVRRKAHGVTLTPSGHRLLHSARALLRDASELYFETPALDGELVGPVTIGCYITLAPTVLPAILDGFGRVHPGVQINIIEDTQSRMQQRLESGEMDLAIVYDMGITGNPQRVSLLEKPAHVLLHPDHPLAAGPTVRLKQLIDEPFILLESPPSGAHTLSLFAEQGLQPLIRHRTASYETVRAMVARGLGYGIQVQRPHNAMSYEGLPLTVVEIDPPVRPVGIQIIWPESVELTRRAQAVVDFAAKIDWAAPVVLSDSPPQ